MNKKGVRRKLSEEEFDEILLERLGNGSVSDEEFVEAYLEVMFEQFMQNEGNNFMLRMEAIFYTRLLKIFDDGVPQEVNISESLNNVLLEKSKARLKAIQEQLGEEALNRLKDLLSRKQVD